MGGKDSSDNLRVVCNDCNGNRAVAGHCLAALFCALAVANSKGCKTIDVLRVWRLQRPPELPKPPTNASLGSLVDQAIRSPKRTASRDAVQRLLVGHDVRFGAYQLR